MIKIDTISIKNISKKYKNKNIFRNISLKFKTKGITFISGKSGSGKTSLLNIIGNIDKNYQGEICFSYQSKNICNNTKTNKNFKKINVDYVFQDYNLLENLTIEQNLKLALNIKGNNISTSEIVEKIALLGLESNFRKKLVKNLSGGEKQRIAILRSLLRNSDIILADEPTGNLDEKNSEIIFKNLKILSQHKPIIIVSHDLDAAKKYANRIIEINDGQIINISKNKSEIPNLNLKKNSDDFVQNQKPNYNFMNYFRPLLFLSFKDLRKKIFQAILMICTLAIAILSAGLISHFSNLNKTVNCNTNVRLLQADRVTARLLTNKDNVSIVNDTKINIAKTTPLYFSHSGSGNLSYKGSIFTLRLKNFQVVDSSEFFKNRFSPLINGDWIKNKNEIILSKIVVEKLKIASPIGKIILFKPHGLGNKKVSLKIVGINNKGFIEKGFGEESNYVTYIHQDLANKMSEESYLSYFPTQSIARGYRLGFESNEIKNNSGFMIVPHSSNVKLVGSNSRNPNNKYEFLIAESFKKEIEQVTNKSIFDVEFSYELFQDKTPLRVVGLWDDRENPKNSLNTIMVMNGEDIKKHKKLKMTFVNIYLKNLADVSKFKKELNSIHKDKFKLNFNVTKLIWDAQSLAKKNVNSIILSAFILIWISLFFVTIFSLSLSFSKRKNIGILKVLKANFGLSILYHSFTIILIVLISLALSLLLYYPINILIGTLFEQIQLIGTNHIDQIISIFNRWATLSFVTIILYVGFSLLIYLQNSIKLLKLNE